MSDTESNKPTIDLKRLTPHFLKGLFTTQMALIEKHAQMERLFYEMMASICHYAPLARPCEVKTYGHRAVAIVQPTHWLVYDFADRDRVRAYAEGTLTEPSLPPRPMGCMIAREHTSSEPRYLAIHGKTLLGEWIAARCITEIMR